MIRTLPLLFALASPAAAAERALSVTDFDRIRVEGSFTVEVREGRAATARVIGSALAIGRTSVEVQDRTLVIRPDINGWGGYPGAEAGPVTVRLTTPLLRAVWVSGSGSLTADRMRAREASLTLDGSGRVAVTRIESDDADLWLSGAGAIVAGGTTKNAKVTARGGGSVDAAALKSADAKVVAEGAGGVTLAVARAADVAASGSGTVTIVGTPACTVKNSGTGSVACGR